MPSRPRSTPLRVRLLLAVAAGLAVAVGGLSPSTAVPVNQSVAVPAYATITITGKGFGHGIGLSQYGARGAARAGLNVNQILSFYYPGTTQRAMDGHIGVRITADNDGDTVVAYQAGLQLIEVSTGRRQNVPAGVSTRWRLSHVNSTTTQYSYWKNNAWVSAGTVRGEGEFYANGAPITLIVGSTQKQYRGSLRASIPAGAAKRETVNWLRIDQYALGVVPLEMPSSWEPAAVQAQAVAARSYGARHWGRAQSPKYHLCDTTACQVYGGYSAEQAASTRAVQATAHRILMHGSQVALTQFSSSSGGWTTAGGQPYLPAKADPYDKPSGNPNHTWSVQVSDQTIERAWPQIGDLTTITITDRSGQGDWSGRVNTITIRGTKGSVTQTGAQVRTKLGLKSTWFAISARAR